MGIIFLVTTILSGTTSAATLGNTPQPKFHHDNQNTGQSNYVGPQTNHVKWQYYTDGMVASTPAIASDGSIYFGSTDGYFYALNKYGAREWRFYAGNSIESSPTLDSDGIIYFGTGSGDFYAMYPNGNVKWKQTITQNQNGIKTSPAIGTDGTIYLTDEYGTFYMIDPANGYIKHPENSFSAGCGQYCSPAIGTDGTVYVADNGLTALNPDGTQKWTHPINGGSDILWSSPAIDKNGIIYIGGMDGTLYAIKSDGTEKWTFPTGQSIETTPAIANDGTIYFESNTGNLYAVNPDGTPKWVHYGSANFILSSPIIGYDGTVYAQNNGVLCAFNPVNGYFKWVNSNCGIEWSSGAIGSDGTLYIGDAGGNLMALKDPTIAPRVVASVKSGIYNTIKYVRLFTTDPDSPATTYYTTDGSNPLTSSTRRVYTNIIPIYRTTILRFAAVDPDLNWNTYTEKYTIDMVRPKVTSTIPLNNKMGYSKTASLTIKFSEKIKINSMYNYITVKNLTTKKYVKITKSILNNLLTIRTSTRSRNTWYQVTIPAKAIKDYAGNSLLANYTFKFRTGA